MVNRVKGGGRAPPPPPSPGWANFSIMMECTPESSGHCHSVYSVGRKANVFSLAKSKQPLMGEKDQRKGCSAHTKSSVSLSADGHCREGGRRSETMKLARVQTKNTCFVVSNFC